MRERFEARQASGALAQALLQVRALDHELRSVRFFDDGYAPAQRWLREWGALGEAVYPLAEQHLARLNSL